MAQILIAEDTKTNRYILEKMLRENGYDVQSFINGRELLDEFLKEPPDLVITDIQMPIMDGYELLNKIRANRRYDHIPIIVISATYRDIQSRIKGIDSGANDYLTAPIDNDELLAKVKAMLRVKELYENLLKSQTELKKTNKILKNEITRREFVESALRESEEKYRQLYEYNRMPISIFDIETLKFLSVNNAFVEKYGYTKEEFLKMTILGIRPESEIEKLKDSVKITDSGLANAGVFLHKKKNGEIIHVEIIRYDLVFEGKNAKLVFVNDITDRKRAEEKMRYQADLLQNVSDAIIATSQDGSIQIWNPAAEKIYGWKSEEVNGRKFHDILKPEYRYGIREDVFEKIKTDNVWSGEIVHHHKDGKPLSILSTISKLKDTAGNQTGLVSVNHDITQRKQAEEKVNHLAAIVQSSADAIIGKSLDGIITSWNKGAEKLYGFTESEVIGKSISLLIPPGNDEDISTILDMIKSGEYIDKYETVRRRKDGREIQVSLAVSPILNSEGKIIAASTIGRDITKQKEILAAMQASAGQSNGLKNLIPICAGCNKIRDDDHESHPWVSPAVYINDRLPNVNFSHGMCPDCMVKWYPDFSEEKQKK